MNLEFVSAGAGSGKTFRLSRIISEAIDGGIEPERIVATTFTNKAAEEIRERVTKDSFGRASRSQAMGAVAIGTVNSVCGRLLGKFAFEAGLSPRLRVIEVDEAERLLTQVMEKSVSGKDREALLRIEERFGYQGETQNAWMRTALEITAMARSNGIGPEPLREMGKKNAAELLSIFPAALVDPDKDLEAALAAAIPGMEKAQGADALKNSAAYLEKCREMLRALGRDRYSWKQWAELARGGYGKNIKAPGEAVAEVAQRYLAHPRLRGDIEGYLRLCFSAAADSLEAFARAKREAGLIDFVDQECLLNSTLDKPQVKERIREELGLLVVDEFQDTSPIQLAVFLKLAGLAGRCVWVGDVKQSIYGFRGSDATLMASILASMPALKAKTEILPNSWRSRPPLVELANAIFVPAFSSELKPEEVALKATRGEYTSAPAFEHWILAGKQSEQAVELAVGLLGLMASGFTVGGKAEEGPRKLGWEDIAILVRSNDAARLIRSSLGAAGIPCGSGISNILSTPEGSLFVACLRRLNDQGDSLASAEILGLSQGLSPESWLEERIQYVSGAEARQGLWRCQGDKANSLLASIEELRPLALLLSPLELSQALVLRCGLDRVAAAWSGDPARSAARVANLDAMLGLVADWEDDARARGEGVSLSRLILHLRDAAGTEDGAAAAKGAEGVQVLTYHSAKGLEWPVCVCCDTTKDIRDDIWGLSVTRAASFSIDDPLAGRAIRYWPWPFGRLEKIDELKVDGGPGVAELRASSIEETRRLLYVGLTRARDLLVLALPEKKTSGGLLASLGKEAEKLLAPADPGAKSLVLPSGASCPYARRQPGMGALHFIDASIDAPLQWFDVERNRAQRLPALLIPSEQTAEQAAISRAVWKDEGYSARRLAVPKGRAREAGLVYHALVAWACSDPAALDEARTRAFLAAQADQGLFDAKELSLSIRELLAWIGTRWPGARLSAEIPLTAALGNGQAISGRIDLLIEAPEGLVIVDHKLVESAAAREEELAAGWLPQMEAYASAIETATGKRPTEAWINLASGGRALRVLASPGPSRADRRP